MTMGRRRRRRRKREIVDKGLSETGGDVPARASVAEGDRLTKIRNPCAGFQARFAGLW